MNIDCSNPKYTLEEIAQQCMDAVNRRGKVRPSVYAPPQPQGNNYQFQNWCE